jgi:hypothetical protein
VQVVVGAIIGVVVPDDRVAQGVPAEMAGTHECVIHFASRFRFASTQ